MNSNKFYVTKDEFMYNTIDELEIAQSPFESNEPVFLTTDSRKT